VRQNSDTLAYLSKSWQNGNPVTGDYGVYLRRVVCVGYWGLFLFLSHLLQKKSGHLKILCFLLEMVGVIACLDYFFLPFSISAWNM